MDCFKHPPVPALLFIFIGCWFLSGVALAQSLSEINWYFGDSPYSLQFNIDQTTSYLESNRPASPGASGTPGGGFASVNSPLTGDLLFYSDGETIYDASHEVIDGGIALNGDPGTGHPIVVVPNPTDLHSYFVFTKPAMGTMSQIRFSEVDMRAAGNGSADAPLGSLSKPNEPTNLMNPGEPMLVVPGIDSNVYWLLTQDMTNLEFVSSKISVFGLQPSVSSLDVTSSIAVAPEASSMKAETDATGSLMRVAVAPKSSLSNIILLRLDRNTGELFFDTEVLRTGFSAGFVGESVYDVAWAPGGQFLYYSRYGGGDPPIGNLHHVQLASGTIGDVLDDPVFGSYGLKSGIDGNVYHLYQATAGGPHLVGRFAGSGPGTPGFGYEPDIFEVDFNGKQFPKTVPPSFAEDDFEPAKISHLGECAGAPILFFANIVPEPTHYLWDFGDGTSPYDQVIPMHTFDAPGSYVVRLTVSLSNVTKVVTLPITILGDPPGMLLMPDLGADTTICPGETLDLDPGVMAASSYRWSTGEISPTITIDQPGDYWVEAVGVSGCASYDDINVAAFLPPNVMSTSPPIYWYFGERAGLDFASSPPATLEDLNMMESAQNCQLVFDGMSQLRFYTNGSIIWNRDHDVMLNGILAPGRDEASQGLAIAPFPEDLNRYFIFTAHPQPFAGEYSLTVSVVDLKGDMGRGSVIAIDMPLFGSGLEKIVSHSSEDAGFLVTHGFGNNHFRFNELSPMGLGATMRSPIGKVVIRPDLLDATGYMRVSPEGGLLANLLPESGLLEIFTLEDLALKDALSIDTEETGLYGLSFSPSGERIYLTTSASLIQYDLEHIGEMDAEMLITDSKFDTYPVSTGANLGALSLAPDDSIIIAVENSARVSVIGNPDNNDIDVSFGDLSLDLGSRMSRRGLPEANPSNMSPPESEIVLTNACLGQPLTYAATARYLIDEFSWDFGEGATPPTSIESEGEAIFNVPGVHTIQLIISNRCGYEQEFLELVEVFQSPPNPINPPQEVLCRGDLTLTALAMEDPSLTYTWRLGEEGNAKTVGTLRELQVLEAGEYSVYTTDIVSTCSSAFTTTFVADQRPVVDGGPDRILCQFDEPLVLDSGQDDVTYAWYINQVEAGANRTIEASTQLGGVFVYLIEITEPFFDCIGRDEVTVTVGETPDVSFEAVAPSVCGASDGMVTPTLNSAGSAQFSLSGQGINFQTITVGPVILDPITGMSSGVYDLVVLNLLNGCSLNEPYFLEDITDFNFEALNVADCGLGVNTSFQASGANIPEVLDLSVYDEANELVWESEGEAVPLSAATLLDPGTYRIEAFNPANNCVKTNEVEIEDLEDSEQRCIPFVEAPTAFSPDGNGLNDQFFLFYSPLVVNFQIHIYSRWGELVFYSDRVDFRWSGDYKDQPCMADVFSYSMQFTSSTNPLLGTIVKRGSVTLVR